MSTDDSAGEVTEFAALLTELKGRTERSYGSLARRLGMNTSTLHRYCAGEAVPQDFAPVERLAEFCGATPEERLELHRRWLQAVAARQRPRGAVAETRETPETLDAQATEVSPGTGAARPLRETEETSGTAEAPKNSEAAFTEGSAETRSQALTPASPVVQIQKPDEQRKQQASSRPWYRGRRASVLVGAACALLATLGTLSALPDGGRHPASVDASRSTAPVSGVPTGTAGPHRAPASSAAAPTPVSPTPGAISPVSGSGSARPSRSAAPTGGGNAAADTGVPLAWTADSQVWALGCGHDYVIDKPPAQVPPPPTEQDAGPWATAQGAVHGRETNVEISVQGRSSTAVVLTALRVRMAGRATPTPGTVYAMDRGCGGSLSKRYFAVDLDKDRPVARSVAGNDAGTPIPAVSLPYRVSNKDPEVLLVTAQTENCDCNWYLELDWSSQGRTGTVRIDDHGRPFRTSGIKGLPRYWYGSDEGERKWVPAVE
ncbi:helix-turn-helix domain-containing protein [Streptomyces sp. AK04-3B]|uniref:helix-turn-helix domain-containing protein n=1 Tax=Streptomyces sp. AK04-3B TaxID=3028650 RepID=UPI0029BE8718|nr:helix-turn-helix domain-containing protein [Streptomyces sp. AK04-3B]MDX3801485.1 helix-turn-helix domain-containing protein [Streptomyces sp. AK04-3B]